MPIWSAPLLCIPVGLLFYFEARWLIRYCLGRYEQKERKAARLIGAYGALFIPIIFGFGSIERAIPGRVGELTAYGFFVAVSCGFAFAVIASLNEGKELADGKDH